jgi:hypothetical protein
MKFMSEPHGGRYHEWTPINTNENGTRKSRKTDFKPRMGIGEKRRGESAIENRSKKLIAGNNTNGAGMAAKRQ